MIIILMIILHYHNIVLHILLQICFELAYSTVNEFKQIIINELIRNIVTRGKFIVVGLDKYSLLIYLRMEGKFLEKREILFPSMNM